jgi:exonuclease SbcD
MKFVHAADLHLDSPLRGLARQAFAPIERVRTASRKALVNLVELCLSEAAQLLVIAGDVYDGDWRDYSTGLFFAHQLGRLREAGVRVVMIRGNHDAASQITRNLRLPDNVHELSPSAAESLHFPELGLVLHGQSFATRSVTANLAESYPARVPQLLNIGLLHTSVNGRAGHEPYAPCSLDDLKSKGYDYWALGHVHTREVLCQAPWVVFPGNLQARHAREVGEKGATVVTFDQHGIQQVEARALDLVRYAPCLLDLSEAVSFDDALDRLRPQLMAAVAGADGRALGLRLQLIGATALHGPLLADDGFLVQARLLAQDLGPDELWIEKLVVTTSPPSAAGDASHRDGPLAELVAALAQTRRDPAALGELAAQLAELRPKLPAELREGDDGVRLDDPQYLADQLDAVEQLLLTRLLEHSA